MKVAKTQPYLFPYLGYFQLINAVDYFGVADDVQYIKQGWITSNGILQNNKNSTFSFSVKKDSYEKNINQRYFTDNFDYEKKKFVKTLNQSYSKAPLFDQTIELITSILSYEERNIALFLKYQLKQICRFLEIETVFIDSDQWQLNNDDSSLDSQERLLKKLSNLSHLGTKTYINPIGGAKLYNKNNFLSKGINLKFLKMDDIIYKQFNSNFTPNLSIIDVLMFNERESVKKMLDRYQLL